MQFISTIMMNEAALNIDLHDKIEHTDPNQLKELYGLVLNYFNGTEAVEEWDTIPEAHKQQIELGLKQVDAGLGKTFKAINEGLKAKYGLDD